MTSTELLKHGKNDGVVVYVPKETIFKEIAAKIEQVTQAFLFFYIVQELSDSTSYIGAWVLCFAESEPFLSVYTVWFQFYF
jgi:hypothetical protein